eukprot:COSAG02_NODE_16469_length_1080_cov_2.158002_1_plen_101_part_00
MSESLLVHHKFFGTAVQTSQTTKKAIYLHSTLTVAESTSSARVPTAVAGTVHTVMGGRDRSLARGRAISSAQDPPLSPGGQIPKVVLVQWAAQMRACPKV